MHITWCFIYCMVLYHLQICSTSSHLIPLAMLSHTLGYFPHVDQRIREAKVIWLGLQSESMTEQRPKVRPVSPNYGVSSFFDPSLYQM